MRRLLLKVHRYLGLLTFAFLIVAAATGVPLAFADALDAALTPRLHRVADQGAPPPAPVTADAFQRAHPGLQVTAFPLIRTPGRALELKVAAAPGAARGPGYDQAFVDPYHGRLIGVRVDRPGWDLAHLMRGVYLLHYTLLAGDWGRWIMGLAASGWLVGNLVGVWLTLPRRKPVWRRWAASLTVHSRAPWPRLLLDLHRASGLWLIAAVTVLAATSVAMNFYADAFRPLVTAISPPRPSPWDRPPPPADPAHRARLSFDQAEAIADDAARRNGLTLLPAVETYDPARRLFGLRFTADGREDYAGYGPVSYYLDDVTGRLVYIDDPGHDSLGQKTLRLLYPLHSGQIAGWPTRLVICGLGLAVLEMSITGLILWLRRRPTRRGPAQARPVAGPARL